MSESILTNYSDAEVIAYARRLGLDTLGTVSAELITRLEERNDEVQHYMMVVAENECQECGGKMG